jgi:hypothetical protein
MKVEEEACIEKLLTLGDKIDGLTARVKSEKRDRLFINDPEYHALQRYRKIARALNDDSMLKLTDDTIDEMTRDVYPMYLCLEQFLNNGKHTPGVLNGLNGAGGHYQVQGMNVCKQTAPGKYEHVFDVPIADKMKYPDVHVFGEDILALHYGYRGYIWYAEIFSETSNNKFEKIDEVSCTFAETRPVRTLWSYDSDDRTRHFIAKTKDGYQTHKYVRGVDEEDICIHDTRYGSAAIWPVIELHDAAEQYLTQKYLTR